MSNHLVEKKGIRYNAVAGLFGPGKYGYIDIDKLEKQVFMTQEQFNNL